MQYLLLAAAALLFASQFVFTKLYQKNSNGSFNAAHWQNLWLGLFTALFVAALNRFQLGFSTVTFAFGWVFALVSMLSGVVILAAMRFGQIAVLIVFSQIGSIVLPFIYGVGFLSEQVVPLKVIGVAVVIAALLPRAFGGLGKTKHAEPAEETPDGAEEQEKRGNKNVIFYCLCAASFLLTGTGSTVLKAHQVTQGALSTNEFMVWASMIKAAVVVPLIVAPAAVRTGQTAGTGFGERLFYGVGKRYALKVILMMTAFAAAYAACNGFGNVIMMNVAKKMDASVQFPLLCAMIITFTTLFSALIFREKLGKSDFITVGMAIAGTVIFMFV
jgi:drug/metabolite transporter (DMT)-like permease